MNVLAIGNGFSHDATRYLHGIAKSDGFDMTVVNLNAYKCSLSDHYKNHLTDAKAYFLEFNGVEIGFKTSIKEALLSRDWDAVVLQQLSSQSIDYETYQPYIDSLAKYIRKYADKYQMSVDVKTAYDKAAQAINADKVIPSCELFLRMSAKGVRMYRDGVRASAGLGKYALGLLWYACITGKNVSKNTFSRFDEPITSNEIEIAKQCVEDLTY